MTLTRREFIQTRGGDGRLAGMGRSRTRIAHQLARAPRSSIPKASPRAIPDADSVILWTRRPFDRGRAPRPHRRGRRGPGLPPRRGARTGARLRGVRLDQPRARRRPQASARLLVSVHRRGRQRQPRSAAPLPRRCARRSAPGQLRLRQLPGRQRRQAQRLSPHDLRRRARARPTISSASCCTLAISSTRSSNIPKR